MLFHRMLFYYVVKLDSGYVVWEITHDEMAERIRADPTLAGRLDRAPFRTRAEAERRRDELADG
jgi:hypothetical protein